MEFILYPIILAYIILSAWNAEYKGFGTYSGMPMPKLNPYFEHTITSGMYNSFFELIIHDVPYDEAMECFMEIYKFYQAGWSACMGLK